MANTHVVNIRLPDDVLAMLDNLVEQKKFRTRSDAIRHFAREYVREERA